MGVPMRRINHLTLSYILSKAKVRYDEWKNPGNPWLTSDSVKFINEWLKPSDSVVEFGAGRSTRWFLERAAKVFSFENNRVWFDKVASDNSKAVSEGNLDLVLLESKSEFEDAIRSIPNDSIDFALVDGVYRDVCALEILPKIRKGGIIVVDNINWYIPCIRSKSPDTRRVNDGVYSSTWAEFLAELKNARYVWTTNNVSDTGIWFKD